MQHEIVLSAPSVPYGPAGVPTREADAAYYASAARNIRFQQQRGRSFSGRNVTEIVALTCDRIAEALREQPERGPASLAASVRIVQQRIELPGGTAILALQPFDNRWAGLLPDAATEAESSVLTGAEAEAREALLRVAAIALARVAAMDEEASS